MKPLSRLAWPLALATLATTAAAADPRNFDTGRLIPDESY